MDREEWIGARVARLRDAAKLTQTQLARRAGLSREYVGRIEAGKKPVSKRATVAKLAAALSVDVTELIGQPVRTETHTELLVQTLVRGIRGALDDEPQVATVDVEALRRDVDAVLTARMACDWGTLAALLPQAIEHARAATELPATRRDGLALFARAAFAGALAIKPVGFLDLAARLTERMRTAVELLDSPAEHAAVAYVGAQVALASGTRGGWQRSLATATTAAQVALASGGDEAAELAVMLHLHAGLSAATWEDSGLAGEHLEAAGALLPRQTRDPWRMEITRPNLGVWQVATHLEAGQIGKVVEDARRIDPAGLRTRQRAAHLRIFLGRGMYLAGKPDQAVKHFLAADAIAPGELRSRPSVREIVGQLDRESRRDGGTPLQELVRRLAIDPL